MNHLQGRRYLSRINTATTVRRPLSCTLFIPLLVLIASGILSGCDAATKGTTQTLSTQPDEVATLRIAAASNLANTLPTLIDAYQQSTASTAILGTTDSSVTHKSSIEVSYGSSGKLYAQIVAGAPYDIYLAANQTYPAQLAKEKKISDSKLPFTYARGQLALYHYGDSSISLGGQPLANHKPSRTENSPDNTNTPDYLTAELLRALLEEDTSTRIALANPQLAPYGEAARAYLQTNHLYGTLSANKRLIQAENIGQVLQYVQTGNVAYGFVALSQLISLPAPTSSYRILPLTDYPAILQDGLVVSDHSEAEAFAHYLQSAEAQKLLDQSGYAALN